MSTEITKLMSTEITRLMSTEITRLNVHRNHKAYYKLLAPVYDISSNH